MLGAKDSRFLLFAFVHVTVNQRSLTYILVILNLQHSIYICYNSKLIVPVVYFAEPDKSSLWAVWQSNMHRKLDFCPRHLTVLIYILWLNNVYIVNFYTALHSGHFTIVTWYKCTMYTVQEQAHFLLYVQLNLAKKLVFIDICSQRLIIKYV